MNDPSTAMTNTVLVTGATGSIGSAVVHRLCETGATVRILVRRPTSLFQRTSQVEFVYGDICNPDEVKAAVSGCTRVVHMAALLHIPNPPESMYPLFWQANVEGTRNVVAAAEVSLVERLVFISTFAVYGSTGKAIVDETYRPEPDSIYGQTKLAAEHIALGPRLASGEALATVLRLTSVYGERVTGNYRRLLVSLQQNRFVPIGNGCNRRTLIYDADVANAVVLALQHPVAAGKIYNVTDGSIHTLRDIVVSICEAMDRSVPRLAVPAQLARIGASMAEGIFSLVGMQPPITRAAVDKYLEDAAVDGSLIQRELGYKPQFDLQTGWRAAIHRMRETGML